MGACTLGLGWYDDGGAELVLCCCCQGGGVGDVMVDC